MSHRRVILWEAGNAFEIIVLRPPDLAPMFGIKEGHHVNISSIDIETPDSAQIFVINDPHDELGFLNETTNINAVQDKAFISIAAGGFEQKRGMDAVHLVATTGGVGFQESVSRGMGRTGWDILKNLVLVRGDDGDLIRISIVYDIVPGEMFWDPLSETDKIRQLTQIQASAGTTWSQPGTEPGEPYNKVDLSGNP